MLEHTFRSASIAASVPLRETLLHGPRDAHLAIVPQLVVAEPRNPGIFAQSIREFPSFGSRLSDMWRCELNIWGTPLYRCHETMLIPHLKPLLNPKCIPEWFRRYSELNTTINTNWTPKCIPEPIKNGSTNIHRNESWKGSQIYQKRSPKIPKLDLESIPGTE